MLNKFTHRTGGLTCCPSFKLLLYCCLFMAAFFMTSGEVYAQCQDSPNECRPETDEIFGTVNGPDQCLAKRYCSNSGAVESGLINCTNAADTDGCGINASVTSPFANADEQTQALFAGATCETYDNVQWIVFVTPPTIVGTKIQAVGASDSFFLFYAGSFTIDPGADDDVSDGQYTSVVAAVNNRPRCDNFNAGDLVFCTDKNQYEEFDASSNPDFNNSSDAYNVYYAALFYDEPTNGSLNFKIKECEVKDCPAFATTCPSDVNLDSCLSEAQVDTAFGNFLNGFSTGGGQNSSTEWFINDVSQGNTKPTVASLPSDFQCGGSITIRYLLTDDCNIDYECERMFSVTTDMTDPEIADIADYTLEGCNTDWPTALSTTWSDNCASGGDLDSDGGVDQADSEDGCTQYRLYTFTVTDDCGNDDTETTLVSRDYDMTDPEIVAVANYELEGCNTPWPANLTTDWTDNCSAGGQDIVSDGGVDQADSEDGCTQYRLYTFTVTDDCGNDDTETTLVSRDYDMTDPEIADIADYTLEGCNDDWPAFLTTDWSDNCSAGGLGIQSDGGVDDGQSEDGCIQYRLYTFTVTDDCGNDDTETTRVSREYDMTDPEIDDVDDYQLANCNDDWPAFLTTDWSDNCSAGGLGIQSDGGVDDGQSEDGCIQYRLYTFTVTDDCGNDDTETTRVSREYDMTDPEIDDVDDYQLANCNDDWPAFLTTDWSDNCSAGGLGIQSDGGVDDGQSEDGCIQYRLYTFTVTDDCGNDDTETTRVSREYDMTDPEIDDVDDYQLANCNDDWPAFLTTDWSDNCSAGGLGIQSDGGVDDGQSEDGCIQYRLYTFTVTDDCGNDDTETTRVSREYDMTDPEIDDVDDYQLANCNDDWPAFLTTDWSDNCSAGGLGIQSDGGVDDGQSEDGCIQYRLYTFTVTDDCGNDDTETTRVSREYDMTDPEIDDVDDYQLANCNDDWPAFLTTDWSDNCSAGGLGIQSDGGVDDGQSEDGCIQYRLYTFTVTDDCGNDDTETTRVSREYDMTDPEIDDVDDYQLANCNDDWPAFLTTDWSDNCSAGGLGIQSDGGVDDGQSEDGCIQYRLYTFTVTDDCGNDDTETTRVSREYDMTDPEIDDVDDYQFANCNDDWPAFLTTDWSDNCSAGGLGIQSDGGVDDGQSEDGCIQYRLYTFTVTDDCGNDDTETTRVSREYDMTDPEIDDVDDYQLANCNDDWPAFLTTDWSDNCSAGGLGIQSDGGVDDGQSEDGCIQYRLYTFTVTDDCGNDDTETTRVSREYDMTDPEIDDVDDYQLANCNDDWPAFLTTDWSDNCSAGGLGIQSDGGVDDGQSEDGCIQYRLYTFTVTDDCGNDDTETTRVSREYDMTDPEIDDVDDYQLANCNDDWPAFLTTDWSDNCSAGGLGIQSDGGVDDGQSEDGCIQYRLYTFTVTDDCGNDDTETTRVAREFDETDPELTCPDPLRLCEGETIPDPIENYDDFVTAGGSASDNCGIDQTSFAYLGQVSDGLSPETITRTYSITDNCGNDITCTQTITIYDKPVCDIGFEGEEASDQLNACENQVRTYAYLGDDEDNYSYLWEIVGGGAVIEGDADGTSIDVRPNIGDTSFNLQLTITVDYGNGLYCSSTCNEIVGINETPVVEEKEVCVGETVDFGIEGNATYESSDDAIATIDANGIATGVSQGKVLITVTLDEGEPTECSSIAELTVNPLPEVSIDGPTTLCEESSEIANYTAMVDGADATSGTFVISPAPSGLFTDNGDGTATFSPAPEDAGIGYEITFTYTYPDTECSSSASIITTPIDCIGECETVFAYPKNPGDFGEGGENDDVTCFLEDGFSRWGWTTQICEEDFASGDIVFDLYAGAAQCDLSKGTKAGEAIVSYNSEEGTISVQYVMDSGYVLSEAHVYIGCTPYPQQKKGKRYENTVAPGQYPFNPSLGGYVQDYTVGPINVDFDAEGCVYIIIHGVSCEVNCEDCDITDILSESNGGGSVTGTVDCTPTDTVTTVQGKTSSMRVSPNPFVKDVKVNYSFDYNTKVKIDVVDIKGVVVKSYHNIQYKKGSVGSKEINLSNALDRMLFVRVTSEKETMVKKVVSLNNK
ncbi:Ig-like domain (group 2) [Flavobacteriaceae bacterium MAR_2010_188]|nr:Ig-like domain (group 2) [Flavobacteriaceae bacterium MAR_2010_188]